VLADEDRRVALGVGDASVSRSVSIRCMKSAGSSHSNAVMNSWSSIPNEYVVWLWIVSNSCADAHVLVHRALTVVLGQRVPRAHLHERVDDEVGLVLAA
jgi:hypothetical protein